MMKAILAIFAVLCCGVAFAAPGDVVVALFADPGCTTLSTLASDVPQFAPNGTCVFSPAFNSSFYQTSFSNGTTIYGFRCDSTCTGCQVAGTTSVVAACIPLLTGILFFQGLPLVASSTVTATVQTTRFITNSNAAFINQTCSVPTTTTFTQSLGSCVRTSTGQYQLVTQVTGRVGISYSVSRNCTDSACLNCRNGAWYTSASTCFRIDNPTGAFADVVFSPFSNTTGTTSTSSSTSSSSTSTSTGSTGTTSSAAFTGASALFVLSALAVFLA